MVQPAQWAAPRGWAISSSGWNPVSSSSNVSRMSSKLLLVMMLLAGHCHSWLWFPDDADSDGRAPTTSLTGMTSPPTTTTVATTSAALLLSTGANGSKVAWEEDEDASGGGEGRGAEGVNLRAANFTNDTGQFGGRRREMWRGEGSRSADDLVDPSKTARGALECLLRPPDWPICSWVRVQGHRASLALPNFLDHSSLGEVGAELQQWAWLARSSCHPAIQWFLCLLLVPPCPLTVSASPLPCRSFCLLLQDSSWAWLDRGRLPVQCHHLPEEAPVGSKTPCMSVSTWKGNELSYIFSPSKSVCLNSGSTSFEVLLLCFLKDSSKDLVFEGHTYICLSSNRMGWLCPGCITAVLLMSLHYRWPTPLIL